jgi:hypothetical protein
MIKERAEQTRAAFERRAKKAKAKASAALKELHERRAAPGEGEAQGVAPETATRGAGGDGAVGAGGPFPHSGPARGASAVPPATASDGRSMNEMAEQLDRIEATVASLADAFVGLQQVVQQLQSQQRRHEQEQHRQREQQHEPAPSWPQQPREPKPPQQQRSGATASDGGSPAASNDGPGAAASAAAGAVAGAVAGAPAAEPYSDC